MTIALNGHERLAITESEDGLDVTFSKPVRCVYCAVLINLRAGEAELEEDDHVRAVRYR